MTSPLKKKICFSIAKKVEILDLFQRGNSRADICWTYAIAPSTLFDFIKNEKKIVLNLNQTVIVNEDMCNSLHIMTLSRRSSNGSKLFVIKRLLLVGQWCKKSTRICRGNGTKRLCGLWWLVGSV